MKQINTAPLSMFKCEEDISIIEIEDTFFLPVR